MIDLTIGNKTYRHPSKLEEVTLGQWIDLVTVKPEDDGYDNLRGFSAFSSIPMDALKKAPSKEVFYYITQLTDTLSCVDNEDYSKQKPITKFKIGRYNYYVEQDMDGAAHGRYIDCIHLMKILPEHEYLPYMLAIYCLRKDESYEDIDIHERAIEMRRAKVVIGKSVTGFFLNSSTRYLRDSQLCSQESQQESNSKQVVKS